MELAGLLGNSQLFTFHFLFVLIASLIIFLYSLSVFPKNVVSRFKKNGLFRIIAVNAMGWMMFLRHDPTFLMRDLVVFSKLALIIMAGFINIRKNYKVG
jgi:hypothetical protein